MDDIKALVAKNDLDLQPDQVKRLTTLLHQKGISYLSPEKEEGPFLLYCMGDDLTTIALKSNFPSDIILLTAIRYDWKSKALLLNKVRGQTSLEIQKDLANTMLMATWVSIQRELGQVISGKLSANDSKLIPKNAKALSELMDMVNKVNGVGEKPVPAPAGTVIHATNVQVNQGLPPAEETDADRAKRAIKIKALEG